jgi:hypothetical protein
VVVSCRASGLITLFTTELLVLVILFTTELLVLIILFTTELLVVFILFTTEILVIVVVSLDVFCLGETHGCLLVTLADKHLTGIIGTCVVKERRGMEKGRDGAREREREMRRTQSRI